MRASCWTPRMTAVNHFSTCSSNVSRNIALRIPQCSRTWGANGVRAEIGESQKCWPIFFVAFISPPVWVALSLPWNNNYSRVPLVKFICQLISHLYFMLLFVCMLVFPWDKSSTDLTPAWYEILLLFWLCGLVLTQLTDPKNTRGLGRVPLFVICLSTVGILIHLSAFPFEDATRVDLLYARNQLFAVAMFLTFIQLLDFLTFHHLFGPWGVIIGNLMQDLARFVVILLIFILGFTVHIAAVTKPGFSPHPRSLWPRIQGSAGQGAREFSRNISLVVFLTVWFCQYWLIGQPYWK